MSALPFVKDANPADLVDLVTEFKTSSSLLMHHMLESVSHETKQLLAQLTAKQWRLCMEMSADDSGQWAIAMTMVSPDGKRREPIADVADEATCSPT